MSKIKDLEKRVDELEKVVIWLAEAVRYGKTIDSMPEILKKAFNEKSRPEEKGRQKGN